MSIRKLLFSTMVAGLHSQEVKKEGGTMDCGLKPY